MLEAVFPRASEDVIQKRLETCRACEFRTVLPMVNTEVCRACGCPLLNKTKFQQATCPKGKW